MDKLTNLLYQTNSNVIKESLWAVSNITAGPVSHVERFVESDAFDRVASLSKNSNIDIRKESLFVLCNAITGADFKVRTQIYEKTSGEVIKTLIKGCRIMETRLTRSCLEAIEELFRLDVTLGWSTTDQSILLQFERH